MSEGRRCLPRPRPRPRRRRWRRRVLTLAGLAAIVLVCTLSASSTVAQEEDLSTFLDSVDVNLVNLEVFVTDRQGNRVGGLTREDFEVRVDGEPVELTNFHVVRPAPGDAAAATRDTQPPAPEPPAATVGAAEPAPPPEAEAPRRPMFLTVYVDNVNIMPQNRKRLLEDLRPLLRRRVAAGDQVMLISYDRSLEVVEPFTRDPAALDAALDRLEKSVTRRPEANAQLRLVMSDMGTDTETGRPLQVLVDNYQQMRESEALAAYKGLQQAIVGLAGIPGRKALLYVSDGIPRFPGVELNQLLGEEEAIRAELPSRRARRDLRSFYRQVYRQANAHEVTLYTLDARGPAENFLLSAEMGGLVERAPQFTFSRDASLQEPILELAQQTGGQAILNTFNFAGVLEDVVEDFGHYYSLGFPAPKADGSYHDIDVRVRDRSLRVRHREGYLAKSPASRVADRTESFLLQGWQSNPMGVQLQFAAPEKERRRWRVPVLVRVPAQALTLIPRGDEMVGRLQLFVAARDGEGRASELTRLERDVRISTAEFEKQQAAGDLNDLGYAVELEMRPGPQSLAVGVWDEIGGGESYVYQKVVVGDPS